jgi:K+-transporting ATPase ATPase B chain
MAIFSKDAMAAAHDTAALDANGVTAIVLVSLLVCLIPTTIGALLSAIGIAGMDRLVQRNVLATSGRAVEAAGDVNTLLLDKTGTITFGNRRASAFLPVEAVPVERLARAALLSSLADETPEGRSIVEFTYEKYELTERVANGAVWVPFSAATRMSGVDLPDGERLRKGTAASVAAWVREQGGEVPLALEGAVQQVSASSWHCSTSCRRCPWAPSPTACCNGPGTG